MRETTQAKDNQMCTMTAKFAGTCTKCHGHIAVGTKINWERGSGASHAECPTQQAVKTEQPVEVPTTITKIERLSHFSEMGPYWVDDDDGEARITRAAEYNKTTTDEIRKKLLTGAEVECSYTDFESTPDKIRDGAICAALLKNQEIKHAATHREFAKTHKHYRCRQCGATGYSGSYPFSTAPDTGLCDDCL